MLVFVDIGAHNGQTLEEATKPQYAFDKIYAFEPMPRQFRNLGIFYGSVPTLEILHCGLAARTGKMNVYGDNRHNEASIYSGKPNVNESIVTSCDFIEASEFFRNNLSTEDTNIVKVNCEGAEIPIFNNLIDSGEIWKITKTTICWDSRKIPGMEDSERMLRERFSEIGFTGHECPNKIQGDTHQERIANWLHQIGV
jgi:FkbM family methyltransferase